MSSSDPCLDLTKMCTPGLAQLLTVRGKDALAVMPYRRGPSLTTYMTDYIPPILMPNYNGGLPCTSSCFFTGVGGPAAAGASKKAMKSERIDILGRRVTRKFLYGRTPCDYSPFPDVAAAGRVLAWKKLNASSRVIPTTVDKTRRMELQTFHERCMDFRDYYLDKTGTHIYDPMFDLGRPYPVKCPVDERNFKIRQKADICDCPGFLGPPGHCDAMPCLKARGGTMKPMSIPKPQCQPFECGDVEPWNPNDPCGFPGEVMQGNCWPMVSYEDEKCKM